MSDELRLPDDLAACEALLAAKPLAATGIDRDQLLYRAGWAAGAETARLAAVNLRGIAAWSFGSAAVAASIAVMLTLQWRPNEAPSVVAHPAGSHAPLAAEVVGPRSTELPRVEFAPLAIPSKNLGRLNTGLLAMRQRAMAGAWAEPTRVALTHGDAAAPAAKTAHELMQELLPADSVRPTGAWLWQHTPSGDSI